MKKLIIVSLIAFVSCNKAEIECDRMFECRTIQYSYVQCEFDSNGKPVFFNIQADTSIALVNECEVSEYIKQAYDARTRTYASSDPLNKEFMDKYPVNCNCTPSK